MSDQTWARVTDRLMVTDRCWLWLGSKNTKGYGEISVDGRSQMVHRVAYELHHGPIPEGMVIDHTCHDPDICVGGPCVHRLCANPGHLTATTNAQNLSRQSPKAKTHCLRGHEYTVENTGHGADSTRYCKECRRSAKDRRQRRYASKSEAAAIREWARTTGYLIGTRGRIPGYVLDAYRAGQLEAAS